MHELKDRSYDSPHDAFVPFVFLVEGLVATNLSSSCRCARQRCDDECLMTGCLLCDEARAQPGVARNGAAEVEWFMDGVS